MQKIVLMNSQVMILRVTEFIEVKIEESAGQKLPNTIWLIKLVKIRVCGTVMSIQQ